MRKVGEYGLLPKHQVLVGEEYLSFPKQLEFHAQPLPKQADKFIYRILYVKVRLILINKKFEIFIKDKDTVALITGCFS